MSHERGVAFEHVINQHADWRTLTALASHWMEAECGREFEYIHDISSLHGNVEFTRHLLAI
jgi:hypothetical protein